MDKRIYKIKVRDGSKLRMSDVESALKEHGPYQMGIYIDHGHLTTTFWGQYIGIMVTKTVPITGPWLVGHEWAGDCAIPALSGNSLPYFPEEGEIVIADESPLFPVRVARDYVPDDALNKAVEMRYDQVFGHRVFGVLTARVEHGVLVDRRGLMDAIMPDFEGAGVTADRRWYIRRTPTMSVALSTAVDRVVAKWL